MLGPYQGLQFPVTLSHNVILCHTFTPLLPFPFRNQVVVCVSVLMYWLWSPGLAPDRSSLHRQDTDLSQPNVRPVTPKQLCSPHHHYTIYIGLVNRYSLIFYKIIFGPPDYPLFGWVDNHKHNNQYKEFNHSCIVDGEDFFFYLQLFRA